MATDSNKNVQIFDIQVRGQAKLDKLAASIDRVANSKNAMATASSNVSGASKRMQTSTSSLGREMKGLASRIGGTTIALVALFNVLKGAFSTLKEFEFEMAKVRAITGATDKEFKKLESSAQRLGRTTFFTAKQVAEMQVSLSRLGFTTTEVLNAQEAILNLSTAIGEDLGRTATVVASAIRGFGEDTVETTRFTDVMAKAFSSSALDLEKFQTSMTKVSAIAAMSGFSFEETTAMLGLLTDRGIEASIAGTSLRNILLKLQDPTSDLSARLGGTVHSGEEFIRAMKELQAQGINVAEVMGIVDLRQVQAMNSFIASSDSLFDLNEKLKDVNGTAGTMKEIMGETLEGAFIELKSAYDGFILSLETGNSTISKAGQGLAGFFTGVLNHYANIFSTTDQKAEDLTDQSVKRAKELFNALSAEEAEKTGAKLSDFLNEQFKAISLLTVEMEKSKGFFEDLVQSSRRLNQLKATQSQLFEIIQAQREAEAREEKEKKLNQEAEFIRQTDLIMLKKEEIATLEKQLTNSPKRRAELNKLIETAKEELRVLKAIGTEAHKQEEERKQRDAAKKLDKQLELAIEQSFQDRRQEIIEFYQGKDGAEQTMKNEIFNEEIIMLNEMLNLYSDNAEKRIQIQEKINDMMQKSAEKQMETDEKVSRQKIGLERIIQDEILNTNKFTKEQQIEAAALSGKNAKEVAVMYIEQEVMKMTASLLTSILGSVPFPANVILAAGAGSMVKGLLGNVLGEGGSGTVRGGERGEGSFSPTVSQFERGGMLDGGIFQGASHANGGVKFRVGGTIHEAEGGEAIINKRNTAMFKPILSAINSYGGNGKKFADGGITTSLSNKFATGGITSNNIQELISGSMGTQKVVIVESDITSTQNRVNAIESQATF